VRRRGEVGGDELGLARDLAPRVAQHGVAGAAQGEVAPTIVLGGGGRGVRGVPVELDDDARVLPQSVDHVPADHDVHRRNRDGVRFAQRDEPPLKLAARAGELGLVMLERATKLGAARVAAAEHRADLVDRRQPAELGFCERAPEMPKGH
jgi:hypothetical protein